MAKANLRKKAQRGLPLPQLSNGNHFASGTLAPAGYSMPASKRWGKAGVFLFRARLFLRFAFFMENPGGRG